MEAIQTQNTVSHLTLWVLKKIAGFFRTTTHVALKNVFR